MITGTEYRLRIGDPAPDFNLPATDGRRYSLADFTTPVLVVFFSCNHCPYVQAYEDRVMDLVREFAGKAAFVAINSNDARDYPEDSFDNMVARARERGFNFFYLRDESQEVARAYGGECTPHFLVFDERRRLQYQGRLDDSKDPQQATTHELRDAIQALLEGRTPDIPVTNAFGCSIKWRR